MGNSGLRVWDILVVFKENGKEHFKSMGNSVLRVWDMVF